MGDLLLYSIAIVILVLLSCFFSATETAYSSINRVKFKNMADSKDKREQLAAALGENYEKLITTILIGNNIANIAAATIATLLFSKLLKNASSAASISTLVITVVVLLFGEVAPKTIAKKNPEAIAIKTAPFVIVLFYLFYPVNFLLGLWQKLTLKVFRVKDSSSSISDEELITYVDEAEHVGSIDEYESELIRSAIEFDDLTVRDALTSRVDLEAIDIKASMEKVLDKFNETGYSRLPVYKGSIDNIIGVLNEKDFYKAYLAGKKTVREAMTKQLIMIPPTMKLSDLLRKLQKDKTHIAIVISEFGGTMGIITLEDILEELVGEIWDEHDEVEEQVKQISDNEWEVVGDLNLDEFFEKFDVNEDEEEFDAVTVSGLISMTLERVAKVGDSIKFENLELTVKEVEFNKATWVNVKVLEKEKKEDEESLLLKAFSNKDDEAED